jgi:DNA-binding NarL/FixJ family response regulator
LSSHLAKDEDERIAVALAIDDDALCRRALRALNGVDARFVVASDASGANVLIGDHLLAAGELHPTSLTAELVQADLLRPGSPRSGLPLIVIGEQATINEAMRRGYAGGLLPSFPDAKLRAAVEAAAHGLVCTDANAELVPVFEDDGDVEPGLPQLTLREAEVLQQLMTGASNKEIARRLHISVHTAKFHVAAIAGKLGASGRTDTVARALRLARAMI